jgi:hypothetical protein
MDEDRKDDGSRKRTLIFDAESGRLAFVEGSPLAVGRATRRRRGAQPPTGTTLLGLPRDVFDVILRFLSWQQVVRMTAVCQDIMRHVPSTNDVFDGTYMQLLRNVPPDRYHLRGAQLSLSSSYGVIQQLNSTANWLGSVTEIGVNFISPELLAIAPRLTGLATLVVVYDVLPVGHPHIGADKRTVYEFLAALPPGTLRHLRVPVLHPNPPQRALAALAGLTELHGGRWSPAFETLIAACPRLVTVEVELQDSVDNALNGISWLCARLPLLEEASILRRGPAIVAAFVHPAADARYRLKSLVPGHVSDNEAWVNLARRCDQLRIIDVRTGTPINEHHVRSLYALPLVEFTIDRVETMVPFGNPDGLDWKWGGTLTTVEVDHTDDDALVFPSLHALLNLETMKYCRGHAPVDIVSDPSMSAQRAYLNHGALAERDPDQEWKGWLVDSEAGQAAGPSANATRMGQIEDVHDVSPDVRNFLCSLPHNLRSLTVDFDSLEQFYVMSECDMCRCAIRGILPSIRTIRHVDTADATVCDLHADTAIDLATIQAAVNAGTALQCAVHDDDENDGRYGY